MHGPMGEKEVWILKIKKKKKPLVSVARGKEAGGMGTRAKGLRQGSS